MYNTRSVSRNFRHVYSCTVYKHNCSSLPGFDPLNLTCYMEWWERRGRRARTRALAAAAAAGGRRRARARGGGGGGGGRRPARARARRRQLRRRRRREGWRGAAGGILHEVP
jgi:hypothetical protein